MLSFLAMVVLMKTNLLSFYRLSEAIPHIASAQNYSSSPRPQIFKLEIYLYRKPFFGSRESCPHTYQQEIEDGLASLLWHNGT